MSGGDEEPWDLELLKPVSAQDDPAVLLDEAMMNKLIKMIMNKVLMFTAIGTTNLFELRPSLSLLVKSLALLSLLHLGR